MSDKQGAGFSLKDHLFNAERVQYLADWFHTANSIFDRSSIVRDTMQQLPQLELKARIVHIATSLER